MANKKTGLGRGLGALFDDVEINFSEDKAYIGKGDEDLNRVVEININSIKPNSAQPRKTFDREKLEELGNSILQHGVIQPLVLKKGKNSEDYELVAGERRWRAARLAGLKTVPAIIKELTKEENVLFSIIENIQREDLNPIDEAEAISRMMKEFKLTQEEISKTLGKSRPYIGNMVRLLKLEEEVLQYVREGLLSQGHGKALLGLDEKQQLLLSRKAVKDGWSVRETEKAVERLKKPQKATGKKEKSPDIIRLEAELKDIMGTKVSIKDKKGKGKIEIQYFSEEERERLIELIKGIG